MLDQYDKSIILLSPIADHQVAKQVVFTSDMKQTDADHCHVGMLVCFIAVYVPHFVRMFLNRLCVCLQLGDIFLSDNELKAAAPAKRELMQKTSPFSEKGDERKPGIWIRFES